MTSTGVAYHPITANAQQMWEAVLVRMVGRDGSKIANDMYDSDISGVIEYLKSGKWEEAAVFGDPECRNAVISNEQWIWSHFYDVKKIVGRWNTTSYGNLAVAIHHGSQFPDRMVEIRRLKRLVKRCL